MLAGNKRVISTSHSHTTMNEDVRDILDVERGSTALTKESLMAPDPKKSRRTDPSMKRPQGMHREVFALLYSDSARG